MCGKNHTASGHLASQKLSPQSALEMALLMQYQQPVMHRSYMTN